MTTHREVTEAMKLLNSEEESFQRSQAAKLIADLILEDCGHPAPTPVDPNLSINLTACVTCYAYYSYTRHATRHRAIVGQIVRRHLLAQGMKP